MLQAILIEIETTLHLHVLNLVRGNCGANEARSWLDLFANLTALEAS